MNFTNRTKKDLRQITVLGTGEQFTVELSAPIEDASGSGVSGTALTASVFDEICSQISTTQATLATQAGEITALSNQLSALSSSTTTGTTDTALQGRVDALEQDMTVQMATTRNLQEQFDELNSTIVEQLSMINTQIEEVSRLVRVIKRHLTKEPISVGEFDAMGITWGELEAANKTWFDMEVNAREILNEIVAKRSNGE